VPSSHRTVVGILSAVLLVAALHGVDIFAGQAAQAPAPAVPASGTEPQAVINKYCVSCHSEKQRAGGLALSTLDVTKPAPNADVWERVIEKLRSGAMPPPGRPRPDVATYHAVANSLEAALDLAAAANPNPGRISAVHRLNRTEYNNAVRDLLGLDIDVRSQLPGDETADGSFDKFDLDRPSRALPVGLPSGDEAGHGTSAGTPGDGDVRNSAAHRAGRSLE